VSTAEFLQSQLKDQFGFTVLTDRIVDRKRRMKASTCDLFVRQA
jgi:hypothetical protein